MYNGKVVGSLDVIVRMLGDPDWRGKASQVKSASELRQILIDFCEEKGEAIQVDRNTMWVHVSALT
jgi:hypothetical protein